jgi:hypothetical protein
MWIFPECLTGYKNFLQLKVKGTNQNNTDQGDRVKTENDTIHYILHDGKHWQNWGFVNDNGSKHLPNAPIYSRSTGSHHHTNKEQAVNSTGPAMYKWHMTYLVSHFSFLPSPPHSHIWHIIKLYYNNYTQHRNFVLPIKM